MKRVSQEEMNKWLTEFTGAVEKGTYKRIPYPVWRRLKTLKACYPAFEGDAMTGQICIALHTPDGSVIEDFPVDDGSFGAFLTAKLHSKEGEITYMPPKDKNNVLSYTISDSTYGTSAESALSNKYTVTCDDFLRDAGCYYRYDGTSNTLSSVSGWKGYATEDDLAALKADLDAKLATKEDKKTITNNKENEKMKGFNFDFGPCNSNTIKMSIYGLAVKNSTGTWVSYNAKEDAIVDVDIFNFDGAKYLYKMPTAIKDIAVGDIVIHAGKPMFVTAIGSNSKSLHVVDPISGEKKEVMLTRSPFGFDFATKVVNFLGGFMDTAASADSPFGNMWMLMLASGENNGLADLAPLMLMNGNTGNMNPMMMYFMLSNGSKDNLLPLMFMMNSTNATPATHTCACGGNCGKADTNA